MKALILICLLALAAVPSRAQQGTYTPPKPSPELLTGLNAGFQQLLYDRVAGDFIQDRFYQFKEADNLWTQYSIFVPRNYDKKVKWPLIFMLHGLNITPTQQIRFEGVADLAEQYGYIVVCPMGYSVRSFWGMPGIGKGLAEGEPGFENEKNLKLTPSELAYKDAMNVLEMARKEFNIDENRIFLTGHSMGGMGSYYMAARNPEIWAGVAPIAGGGINDRYAPGEKIKNLPFLVMHGEKDKIVSVDQSRNSTAKMKELGMKYKYLEIPGADHEIWIRHNARSWVPVFEFFNSLTKGKEVQK